MTLTLEELLARGIDRGYVLRSELAALEDAGDDPWLDEAADGMRSRGIEVVDDLQADEDPGEQLAAPGQGLTADSVRQYLNEIGRTPLLTAEEEVDLAKRHQAGLHAQRHLAEHGDLSPHRRAQLRAIERQGRRAKEDMISANLRLVVSVAKRYRGRGVDLLALIQEGNLGLIRSVEKFDHTKGYKFSTYATWWIRQALQRGMANTSRTVRLPVHVHELVGKIRHAELHLLQHLGREPTDAEVARELGLTERRLVEVRRATRDIASLDRPVGREGDTTIGALVPDESAEGPEDVATADLAREEVGRILETLTERERRVLALRYGLADGEEHTLEHIGLQFGLTRERIRQIEKKTLAKLRHPSRGTELRALLDGEALGTRQGR